MIKKGVTGFLMDHEKKEPVSFHMPGHKGSAFYINNGYGKFLKKLVDMDITEIPGADNLFQTEGIIRETMDRYKGLYESVESYLLINGSSTGIIASMIASVPAGGKIIMARNCHKSAFNALTLGRLEPVYAYPETIEGYGISGIVSVEEIARCMNENPDASAVILPSPNYYGICSDIEAIAREVHSRGKILIVDQAHGAHLKFFSRYLDSDMPKSAEEQGADLVINSIHKTLGSFTQSAVLNVNSQRIDLYNLEDKLQEIESTSPSYILMASLDINADIIENRGRELLGQWHDNLEYFYREAEGIEGLKVLKPKGLDETKLNLDMSLLGTDGGRLEELLMEKDIFSELVTGNILMCMTGIGNSREDFERLIEALKEISASHSIGRAEAVEQPAAVSVTLKLDRIPEQKEKIPAADGVGRVCASSIIPYPPGIPIACPGEILDDQVVKYVMELRSRGEKVMGIDDLGRITVGKNKD